MTTSSAACDENFIKMTTFFRFSEHVCFSFQPSVTQIYVNVLIITVYFELPVNCLEMRGLNMEDWKNRKWVESSKNSASLEICDTAPLYLYITT